MLLLTDFVLLAVVLLLAILIIRVALRQMRKPIYLSPDAQQPHRFVVSYNKRDKACQLCHEPAGAPIHQLNP